MLGRASRMQTSVTQISPVQTLVGRTFIKLRSMEQISRKPGLMRRTFLLQILPFMRQYGKNMVELGSPRVTIWHTCIACWTPNATNTQSQYVTIISFPLQQRLHERASMLRYTYITCLVVY